MEQQGTVNNRTFVLLNFRSIIVAIPIFLCADPMGLHESSYDTSVPRYNPMESSAFYQARNISLINFFVLPTCWLNCFVRSNNRVAPTKLWVTAIR